MAWPGKLVEYLENGKFLCALVLEDTGKRLRLVNQNGREVSLPSSRLVHHSSTTFSVAQSREELINRLQETAARRRSLMTRVDLQQIWELAAEEEGSLFTPRFLAELCFGEEATDDDIASFLRCIFEDKLLFKYKNGQIMAHSAELVEQMQLQMEKERQQEELLARGAIFLNRIWQGEGEVEWPERQTCLDMLAAYYLFDNEADNSETARALLKKANLTAPHAVLRLLVEAGVWSKDENIPLLRQALPTTFNDEAMEQALAFTEPDAETLIKAGRRDLRHLPLLTIDGQTTRDFDDALHLEKQGDNFLVGIHIADVAYYVKPKTPLFAAARKRVTSLYFPESTLPMLPPAVSEGICSLQAGKNRLALSFLVLLSPAAEVLEYRLVASIVCVKRQLSYDEVNRILEDDQELATLARLSTRLCQRRLDAGAVLLPFPDVNIGVGADETITVTVSPADTPSRTLVAEFMILANTLGAQYLLERETPGLFRSQPPPHQRIVTGAEHDLYRLTRQRKQLCPMALLTKAKPHSGVGVPQYTTVTSPIRRLLDLVIQLQFSSLLQRQLPCFSSGELKELAGNIIETQGRANQASYQRKRYWLLKSLEPRVNSVFDALIIEKGSKRIKLLLPEFLLETDLPANQAIRANAGATIQLKLTRADALDNLLRFELAPSPNPA